MMLNVPPPKPSACEDRSRNRSNLEVKRQVVEVEVVVAYLRNVQMIENYQEEGACTVERSTADMINGA